MHASMVLTSLFYLRWWSGHLRMPLSAIQSPDPIPISVLQNVGGLHLGDICFAKIQTTLCMRTIPIAVLEKWAVDGSFQSRAHG